MKEQKVMQTAITNRVLVCDDEKNMRRVLEDILTDDNWKVTTAASGEEVLDILKKGESFDAIVVDLSLPGINGLALIDAVENTGRRSAAATATARARRPRETAR